MKSNHLIFLEELPKNVEIEYRNDFNNLSVALQLSGSLINTTKGWIKQIIGDKITENDAVKQLSEIESERWWKSQVKNIGTMTDMKKKDYLKTINLNPSRLNELSTINAKCKLWSEIIWKDYVPQMFLEKKDYYDEVKFKIARIPISEGKKINELYHRIKANENTFDEIAMNYGHGDERIKGGCIRKIRLNNTQKSLVAQLRNRKPGELINPFKLNEWYIIIEIIEMRSAELNEQVSSELITEAFSSFLIYSTNHLIKHLSDKD